MAISFSSIPSTLRVPLFYAEIDPSQAGNASRTGSALIVGQRMSGGSVAADTLTLVESANAAADYFGNGSMLHRMTAAYRNNDAFGELYALAIDDAGGSNAATGTIAIGGPATADGTISLYINYTLVEYAVSSGDAANDIATGLNTAIGNVLGLPVSAGVIAPTITLTARNAGTVGNGIDFRVNYLGKAGGEETPAGVTFDFNAAGAPTANPSPARLTGGATDPALTNTIAAMGDTEFDFIITPYESTALLNAFATELNDTAGRWSYLRQVYGHVFAAIDEENASVATTRNAFGNGRNNQHETIVGTDNSPSWVVEWAAALGARAAASVNADCARPLQSLALEGIGAPAVADQDSISTRNTLLTDGISTTYVSGGKVRLDRVITTYQSDAFGVLDTAYLDYNTMAQLTYFLRTMRSAITTKYPRHKLVDDGTRFGAGQAVVTPSIVKAEILAQYRAMELLAIVENFSAFKESLIVERNATDPNRLDIQAGPDLANQLRVVALLNQFRLQYPTT